jgi:hypothetical protein
MLGLFGSVILLFLLPGGPASAQEVRLRVTPPKSGNSALLLLEAHPGDGYLIFCSAQRGSALVQVGGPEAYLGLARPKLLTGRLESRTSRVGSDGRVAIPIRLPEGTDQVELHFQAVVGERKSMVVTNMVSLTRQATLPGSDALSLLRQPLRMAGGSVLPTSRAVPTQPGASRDETPWTVREDHAVAGTDEQEDPESPPQDAFGHRMPLPPRNGSELPGGGFRAPDPVRARN